METCSIYSTFRTNGDNNNNNNNNNISLNWTMSTTRCRKLLRVVVYVNTSTTAFHIGHEPGRHGDTANSAVFLFNSFAFLNNRSRSNSFQVHDSLLIHVSIEAPRASCCLASLSPNFALAAISFFWTFVSQASPLSWSALHFSYSWFHMFGDLFTHRCKPAVWFGSWNVSIHLLGSFIHQQLCGM